MYDTEPVPDPSAEPTPAPGGAAGEEAVSLGGDPAAGLAILHVVVRAGATNSQYNEHCLPVRASRRITVCSLFPAEVTVPEEIRLVEGDGSVRGCFRALRSALAMASYDVVHVHAPASGVLTMLVYLRARRPRRDLVFTVHSSWSVFRPRNRLFLMAIAAFFPLLVVCGQAAAASLPRRVRFLAKRIEVVSNGVDIDRVDRVLADHAASLPERQLAGHEVTSVLRIRPIKDPGTLVEAFVGAAGPGDSLVLLGVPELPDELSAFVHEAGLDERIRLTGVVERDEVYRTFRESSLFVSTSKGEGLPVSVLEAMACRCPVVLSDIPPHRDIARHTQVIPVVPVGDVAGFRDAITEALRMSESRRRVVGDKLRRCVVAHFSVSAMNEAYGRLYRGVAQRNRPAAPPLTRNDAPRAPTTRAPTTRAPSTPGTRRRRRRLVSTTLLAAVLGASAALGYGATHRPDYEAVTTLAVGEMSVPPTADEMGLGPTDAATVADLVGRQIVLQPVAEVLGVGNWRTLQPRVHSAVGADPMYVDVTASGTTPRSSRRLAAAVADQVVRLSREEAGPRPHPRFYARELQRLNGAIAATQDDIDRALQRMSSVGPPGIGPIGRRLRVLQHTLAQQQDSRQGLLARQSDSGHPPGVTVSNLALSHRSSGPPAPPALAALGAAAGLGALLGVRLLVGGGWWRAGDAEPGVATYGEEREGRTDPAALASPEADAHRPAERVGS